VDPARPVITHCQSHHRSGLSYMVGRLLGFANIRAYHGSWGEWGNRDDLPIET
jgi:thiosulfate/3-mercaptopyruvate sulfurtransferase